MTPENFCYWLQGYFEIGKTKKVSKEQTMEMRKHLAIVVPHPYPESLPFTPMSLIDNGDKPSGVQTFNLPEGINLAEGFAGTQSLQLC